MWYVLSIFCPPNSRCKQYSLVHNARPASPRWELRKMDLIPMFLARKAVADSLGTSQRESFHIFFTLHIYYIIFFYKNQIAVFVQLFNFYQDGVLWYYAALPPELHSSYQGPEGPLSSHLRHLARWLGAESRIRTYNLRHPKQSCNCCYRLLFIMEKDVWRKWSVHITFNTLHKYYNIFFLKSQKFS